MIVDTALARSRAPTLHAEAGLHALQTLLNCYCRELAFREGHASFGSPFGQNDWPLALKATLLGRSAIHLVLPHAKARLVAAVDRPLPLGRLRLRSALYIQTEGRAWAPLNWREFAALLLCELSLRERVPVNDELSAQISDSVETVAAILTQRSRPPEAGDPLALYAESEQALLVGHSFHPAPKSRQGFSEEDRRLYSPELRVRFPLRWFAVRRNRLLQRSLLSSSADAAVAAHAPLDVGSEWALVPTHPWQGRHALIQPAVRRAIEQGAIRDLGPSGPEYIPTSSLRTLFHPTNPFFFKLSLHVRITNCLRKNAHYELDGAVEVTRLWREIQPRFAEAFPDLRVLEEPAFLTVDLPEAAADERTAVNETFGLILREGVQGIAAEGVAPLLAATLFADIDAGVPRACDLCRDIALRERTSYAAAAEAWFAAYVERLAPPVLDALFAHGVVFEPHLQNTLVAVRDGWPAQIVLRDFEGVKLIEGRFDRAAIAYLSPRAREALSYDEQRGWSRVAYCLFVNQIGEAVECLAAGDHALGERLWRILRHELERYQARYGSAGSRERLAEFLAGAPLPAKTNLLGRVAKQADRLFGYAPLANPFVQEPASWM
ncbi:IucA/IucC family siderophore biosynthesis protein [Methylosinus sp. KRF6]|uniref:IucA/IucC family protein n=1 Tax=Methylosinus sp. KRF6 TaxID=2846853 RepID=UPI001C0CA149|nr:IucA/IucC family protein [Methylosinus sp. KRF6]MBU3891043.1 hypothetical protein [Methylosinus sp. KRF6]